MSEMVFFQGEKVLAEIIGKGENVEWVSSIKFV